VVETRADEFFAVFEQPAAALDAAIAVQRELRERSWPEGVQVRVRAGIHSGYPTTTDDNYIGLPVHAASRICGAAHGGQILVSGDTREAVRSLGPSGVRFRGLGQYRLRGLPGHFSLFQVAAKGLPAVFPPPRTPPAV
jgi:class 3 adenylate cyclase